MIIQKIHSIGMFIITASTMLIGQASVPADARMVDITTLKNQQITLSISSSPSRAEIYINKEPGRKTSPDAYTPIILKNIKETTISLTLLKKGYSDTTILLDFAPATTQNINIFMVPLPVTALEAQNQFLRDRFHVKLGRYCFISFPMFMAAGAGFLYYSENNKEKADKARSYLDKTIIQSGPEFEAMQQQYTNETRKRNLKLITGIALFGVAAVDLGAGLVLYF